MSFFVLKYVKRGRTVEPEIQRFEAEKRAFQRLREMEKELLHDGEYGVVLLIAEDEDDLRMTHPQYFESFDTLRERVEA